MSYPTDKAFYVDGQYCPDTGTVSDRINHLLQKIPGAHVISMAPIITLGEDNVSDMIVVIRGHHKDEVVKP